VTGKFSCGSIIPGSNAGVLPFLFVEVARFLHRLSPHCLMRPSSEVVSRLLLSRRHPPLLLSLLLWVLPPLLLLLIP
jgi:hypothetical protein